MMAACPPQPPKTNQSTGTKETRLTQHRKKGWTSKYNLFHVWLLFLVSVHGLLNGLFLGRGFSGGLEKRVCSWEEPASSSLTGCVLLKLNCYLKKVKKKNYYTVPLLFNNSWHSNTDQLSDIYSDYYVWWLSVSI